MAKWSVMVNRTRTVESSVELEITAKDEEAAQAKAEEKVTKAAAADKLDDLGEWEETSDEDQFDYEASEG